MGKYYISPLKDYHEELVDSDYEKIGTYFASEVQQVDNMMQSVVSLTSELSGVAASEITNTTLGTIANELGTLSDAISESLVPAVDEAFKLKNDLDDLQTQDDNLFSKEKILFDKTTGMGNFNRYKSNNLFPIMDNDSVLMKDNRDIAELRSEIASLNQVLEKIVTTCNGRIENIQAFEDAIDSLTSAAFSFSLTMGNTDFSQFSSLSTDEKKAMLKKFIDSLTERYNSIRGSYLFCDMERFQHFQNVLTALGFPLLYDSNTGEFFVGGDPMDMDFLSFLDISEGLKNVGAVDNTNYYNTKKNILEIFDAYFVKGESWENSGMQYLYSTRTGNYDNSTEIYFMQGLINMYLDSNGKTTLCGGNINAQDITRMLRAGKDVTSIFDQIKAGFVGQGYLDTIVNYYPEMVELRKNYEDNVTELYTLNSTIYNLGQFEKMISYFEVESLEDYQNFEFDLSTLDEVWLKKSGLDIGVTDGYDYNELFLNMTDEEKKMFAYQYSKGGISAAREFLKNDADAINSRVGYNNALEFVEWISDKTVITRQEYIDKLVAQGATLEEAIEKAKGYPEEISLVDKGIDFICDMAHCTFKGVGDGFNTFVRNITSIVDPMATLTPEEYEAQTIISLFSNESSPYYNEAYLGAYNVGTAVGKDGIKTILQVIPNPIVQAIATGLDVVETLGSNTLANMRQTGDYTTSFQRACFKTLTTESVNYLVKKIPGFDDVSNLGQSITKNVLKNESGVAYEIVDDYMFGEYESNADYTIKMVKGAFDGTVDGIISDGLETNDWVVNNSGHLAHGTAGGLSNQASDLSSRFKGWASDKLDSWGVGGKISDKTLDFVGNWIETNYKNIGNGTVATAKDTYGYYVTELFDFFGGDVGGNGQFDPYSETGKVWFANVSKQYPDLTKKVISKVTEVEKGLTESFYKEFLEPIIDPPPLYGDGENPFKG